MERNPRKNEKNVIDIRIVSEKIDELQKFYKPINLEREYNNLKKKSVKKLNYIIANTNRLCLQSANIEEILNCSLTAFYYFGMNVDLFSKNFWSKLRKRNFTKAEQLIKNTMNILLPEKTEESMEIILNFITKAELWPYESFVGQIFEIVLYYSSGKTAVYTNLLNDVKKTALTDVVGGRHRMRVLYELLNSENWAIDQVLPLILKLLNAFGYSINHQNTLEYFQLRKGFEICLRRIFERVNNEYRVTTMQTMLQWLSTAELTSEELMEFSGVLEYPAELYKAGLYEDCFDEQVLDNQKTLWLVESPDPIRSLIGCRLLHRFLDRQCNSGHLSNPIIFYKFLQGCVQIGTYHRRDKAFLRQHRLLIHNSLIAVVKLHREHLANVKAIFPIIACMILEVPCGLTAAAAACMVMDIQKFALDEEEEISPASRCWLNALVGSVLSLICWVHKASELSRYVNAVIKRRWREAPHLNPPLLPEYSMTDHNQTWSRPVLYFEDWELRYGLWKHFHTAAQRKKTIRHMSS